MSALFSCTALRQWLPYWCTGHQPCKLTKQEEISPGLIACGVIGMGLFFAAPQLAESMFFRVSTGTVTFMLLSVLILLFLFARYVGLGCKTCTL